MGGAGEGNGAGDTIKERDTEAGEGIGERQRLGDGLGFGRESPRV